MCQNFKILKICSHDELVKSDHDPMILFKIVRYVAMKHCAYLSNKV